MSTLEERRAQVSRLDGYLEALASIDGSFRDYVMGAVLLELREREVEAVVAEHLSRSEFHSFRVLSVSKGNSWVEVEQFLRGNLLKEPFGTAEVAPLSVIEKVRDELAFQASDMVMFLSATHTPLGIYHLTVAEAKAISVTGCAVLYENDLLLIVRTHWRSKGRST